MSRLVQTALPAFVLIKLPLRNAAAERITLRDVGLPHFVAGRVMGVERESFYVVDADAMYNVEKREGILDMLAVLGVPHILHVGSDRAVTRCDKDNNYLPINAPVIGEWTEVCKPVGCDENVYQVGGRAFTVKPCLSLVATA